ncbi:MAG: MTH938/NDUFAF3 family protein [Archaeoglobaceae archaeon]|nr:MTH938/NDUFAF3 family protein [Archaeoglobaceae archaeon]MDW7989127.1 MTH938/NDUFAF3 family protein [Archaeoglobaceae archaeon]
MIESYEFGKMKIAGKVYTADLIVFPERVKTNWWRREGHKLNIEDLREIVDFKPEVIVVGTGYYGKMDIPEETKKFFEKIGIKLIYAPTKDAVRIFNEISNKKVGAFHLTC